MTLAGQSGEGGREAFDRLFAEGTPLFRYAEAMGRAARNVEPIGLDLAGLTLTPGSVMVCAHPVDEKGNRLMDLLQDELRDDGWREAGFRRSIWYANHTGQTAAARLC